MESEVSSEYINTVLSVSLSPLTRVESCSTATLIVEFWWITALLYSEKVFSSLTRGLELWYCKEWRVLQRVESKVSRGRCNTENVMQHRVSRLVRVWQHCTLSHSLSSHYSRELQYCNTESRIPIDYCHTILAVSLYSHRLRGLELQYCIEWTVDSRESAATLRECCNTEGQVSWEHSSAILLVSLSTLTRKLELQYCNTGSKVSTESSNTILSVSLSILARVESCSAATLRIQSRENAATLLYYCCNTLLLYYSHWDSLSESIYSEYSTESRENPAPLYAYVSLSIFFLSTLSII